MNTDEDYHITFQITQQRNQPVPQDHNETHIYYRPLCYNSITRSISYEIASTIRNLSSHSRRQLTYQP